MASPDDFDPADIDELVTALQAAEVHATIDERDVRTPGVWIRHDSLPVGRPLAGCLVRLTLFLVVEKATERTKSQSDLAALWNKVRPVVQHFGGPSGDVNVRVGLTLPGGPTRLPAYSVPLDLITVATEGETP